MWDLVGNPEDRFSQNEAQIYPVKDTKNTHFMFLSSLTTWLLISDIFAEEEVYYPRNRSMEVEGILHSPYNNGIFYLQQVIHDP